MLIAERSEAHSIRETPKKVTYWIYVYNWPLWRKVVWEIYHYYDMRFPIRVPGWQKFEDWLGRHGAQRFVFDDEKGTASLGKRPIDRLYCWTVRQDFRCYNLSIHKRKPIGSFEVSKEVYDSIK